MASLYERTDSKYWWIEYVDAAGERRQESTKLRRALPGETKKARQLRDELTMREIHASPVGSGQEFFQAWVPRFIAQRYAEAPLTRMRYEQAWRNVSAFLRENGVIVPRQLGRQQVRDFVEWRRVAHPELSVRKGAKNTALLEVKLLGLVIDEAIESGFCNSNPCHRLGIGRDEPKLKPKITMAEHRFVTRMLKTKPEWMRVAYRIAWEQGCRISETHVRIPQDVDLANNVLRLRTKGKKKRAAEVPLSPRLRPMFRRLLGETRLGIEVRQDREFAFDMPRSAPKMFWTFFHQIGLSHLSIHSTRVTFITQSYEDGKISEEDVMRLALHASTTVHRIYPRLPARSRHVQSAMKKLVEARSVA